MDDIVRLFFAAGGLEEFMPYDVDLFQDDVHHTTAYRTLYERLDHVGQLTTLLLSGARARMRSTRPARS